MPEILDGEMELVMGFGAPCGSNPSQLCDLTDVVLM
jgi:hypothetical protein